ncbi:MAG: TonB-dependent receptor [Acidobacteria bacterium]|nr:TonB-dependent receptor [Acidobacteriota bacterium]
MKLADLLSRAATLLLAASAAWAQTTTADILGIVYDSSGGNVSGAAISVRNLDTNALTRTHSNSGGAFRVSLLPAGNYTVAVEKTGFAKYQQGPFPLRVNESADLSIGLTLSTVSDSITVSAAPPQINTTNAEISTNFDSKRIADLPLSTNRNILNLAASAPGVAPLSAGNASSVLQGSQGTESTSLAYSANGARPRSNAFLIDGQDSYHANNGGLLQPLNNPDIVAEVRLVTNQFLPEFGRSSGSVMSIVTKSGSNQFRGSLFWFHNNNRLNALTNADKRLNPPLSGAPFRVENQLGGTFGGRVIRDKTFFFGSLQRWTDRRLGSGTSIQGSPSEEGRRLLNELAGTRPQVKALLENLPAGVPNGLTVPLTAGGRTVTIPLSNLTGSGNQEFDNWQYSYRLDHRFSDKQNLMLRYLDDNSLSQGTGQLTPAGLSNRVPFTTKSAAVTLASTFSPTTLNEFRLGYNRPQTTTNAANPAVAERIPSIEVPQLGLRGFNAGITRTGIGLGVNLPSSQRLNNYQIQEAVTLLRGRHSIKAGFDFRRQDQSALFLAVIRGQIEYATLQALVDDQATRAIINGVLKGGEAVTHMRHYDYFAYFQDQFRIRPNFTISYGVRYETPGNPMDKVVQLNSRIVAANGNDERFRLSPIPPRDRNNWAPRAGLNYRFGDGKLVWRAGYARTYDTAWTNLTTNVAASFPMVFSYTVPAGAGLSTSPNAFTQIEAIRAGNVPPVTNPNILTRTILSANFRSPYADQYSTQFQRELPGGWAATLGYTGTKGLALIQSIDANPTVPKTDGSVRNVRVLAGRGVIRERCNCAGSVYHSLQISAEKRLSRNFLMATHYTWSSFIDTASDPFNPSVSGEIAIPQDPYNRRGERARSTYDRPHRFSTNGVFELPYFRSQRGFAGRVLGGWQLNGFLTLQSGAPFGVLNGTDPGGVGTGNLVGTAIRPFLNTALDLSSMTVRQIQQAGGSLLFRAATRAEPIGDAGRNIFRADGINRLDLGITKNVRLREGHTFQVHANFYNTTNSRDWGIPEGVFTSAAFLNEGAAEVSSRRIQVGLRYAF